MTIVYFFKVDSLKLVREFPLHGEFISNVPVETLGRIFVTDFEIFGNYVVNIVYDVLKLYPCVSRTVLRGKLTDHRLLAMLKIDNRLCVGLLEVVKDCFRVVGANPVLVMLLWTVIEEIDNGRDKG